MKMLNNNAPVLHNHPNFGENLTVSVVVGAYQHVKYIRKCLDGILMQKTDFPFEIILGEDESEDGTREICKEYAKKHPEITHIVYKETRYHNLLPMLLKNDPELKIIGIIRNPKSVMYSWVNAPKEFDLDNWDFENEWKDAPSKNKGEIGEYFGYNKWKEFTYMISNLCVQYPNRVRIVKYTDILSFPSEKTKELFEFSDLPLTENTLDFIENKRNINNSDPYSVFRTNQTDQKWV